MGGGERLRWVGYAASGAPAFDNEARDGDLVELEENKVTVRRIWDLRASGASLRAICSILESEGRVVRGEVPGGNQWLSSECWTDWAMLTPDRQLYDARS
jgi:hypothetical protein